MVQDRTCHGYEMPCSVSSFECRLQWQNVFLRRGNWRRRCDNKMFYPWFLFLSFFFFFLFLSGGSCYRDLYCFNFERKTWKLVKTTGEQPPPRSAHSAMIYIASDNTPYLIIYGGRNKVPWLLFSFFFSCFSLDRTSRCTFETCIDAISTQKFGVKL